MTRHPARRLAYPLVALALSAGAPLGLLGLRAASGESTAVSSDARTYAYVALSTALVFTAFGWRTAVVDGHDLRALHETFGKVPDPGDPQILRRCRVHRRGDARERVRAAPRDLADE